MNTQRFTRRKFLRLSAAAAAGVVVVACQPQTVVVEKEKVVEKEVTKIVEKEVEKVVKETVQVKEEVVKEVTKVVEKEVEKVITATPVSSERESPILQAKVNAGELPSVDNRLPAEPLEMQIVEEIGQYGGTWQRAWLGMDYPWDAWQTGAEPLVRYTQDGGTVRPNLFKEWEIADDGKIYTLYLRKGIKWSDGEPFTADDLMFYFDDILGNEELTPVYPRSFTVEGERAKVEKIDDYTVRFSYVGSYGLFIFGALTDDHYSPKHYMQQFHPNYTSAEMLKVLTKDAGFEQWYELFQGKGERFWLTTPDYPTLWPWICTLPAPSTRVKWDRNAYYWKVDPEGNQLPYIDGVAWDLVQDTQVLSLKAMSGELDFRSWWLSTGDYTLYMENREKGDFRVLLWSDTYGANPMVMLNQTVENPPLREIFQDVRFRQALSSAMNREEINEFAYMGMGIPRQASLVRESAYYSQEWESNYLEYDPDRANDLLDEMGLSGRDADGYRQRPDGETLAFTIEFASIFDNYPDVIELVKEQWEAVGIKVAIKNHQRSLFVERWTTNQLEVGVWTQPGLTVLFNNWWFFNTSGRWGGLYGEWYMSGGESGEQPPEDMVRLFQIWDELQLTADQEKRDALIQEGIDLHIKNLWIIGIVGNLPKIVIVKNRMRNVPEKLIFDNSLGCPRNADPEQFFLQS